MCCTFPVHMLSKTWCTVGPGLLMDCVTLAYRSCLRRGASIQCWPCTLCGVPGECLYFDVFSACSRGWRVRFCTHAPWYVLLPLLCRLCCYMWNHITVWWCCLCHFRKVVSLLQRLQMPEGWL